MTDRQLQLLAVYSKKSRVPFEDLVNWIEKGKTTITEISKGILGTPVYPNHIQRQGEVPQRYERID